jgi:hypothetical protein
MIAGKCSFAGTLRLHPRLHVYQVCCWGMIMSLQMLIIVSSVFAGYMLVSTFEGGGLIQRLRRNLKIRF